MVIRGRLALVYEAAIVIRIASQTAEPDSETPSQLELNLGCPADGVGALPVGVKVPGYLKSMKHKSHTLIQHDTAQTMRRTVCSMAPFKRL